MSDRKADDPPLSAVANVAERIGEAAYVCGFVAGYLLATQQRNRDERPLASGAMVEQEARRQYAEDTAR